MKTRLFPGVALYRRVRRALSENSVKRDRYARMIRIARRERDAATQPHHRGFFAFRAELLRSMADYYTQPNTPDHPRRDT